MCARLGSCVRQSHDDAWEHHQNVCCMLLSSPEHIVNPWFIDWWDYHTAHAFVSSRIDYCNSLLHGIPEYAIKKLQRVHNLAARVVTRSSKVQQHNANAEEIALAACEVSHNTNSQGMPTLLLTFKALHGVAPHYLKTLLQSYIPSRSLRSETGNLLIMPKARRKLGCHSFAVAAPKLWNELPVNIRTTTSIVSFRSSLKTYLFNFSHCKAQLNNCINLILWRYINKNYYYYYY